MFEMETIFPLVLSKKRNVKLLKYLEKYDLIRIYRWVALGKLIALPNILFGNSDISCF